MSTEKYWDDPAYTHITAATYHCADDQITIAFGDGDTVTLAAQRLLGPAARHPDWSRLEVIEGQHVRVPVAPGSGDGGDDSVDVPGDVVRSITDPTFAAHRAAQAAESARRVGARIQALRKARGLTTADVAARVGMAQQNVSRVEQGRHAVSFPVIEKILVAMGYTLRDLLPND